MLDILNYINLSRDSVNKLYASLLPNIISAIVVAIISLAFYLITARIFEAALRRTHMQPSLIRIVVRSLYRGLVIIISMIFVLSQLGINVTAALAGVGVLGIALGFAAQATLSNIFSGFGIFLDSLYRNGEWVTIAGHHGEVVSITLRTTKIRTLDNTYISIPNSVVTSSSVVNHSEKGMVRITAKVAIAYRESVDKAREALVAAASKLGEVRSDPAPVVVVEELADSGVNLLVRIWVDNPGYEQKFFFLLTETCKKALDEAGITIPFPQRDVHVVSEKVSRIAR